MSRESEYQQLVNDGHFADGLEDHPVWLWLVDHLDGVVAVDRVAATSSVLSHEEYVALVARSRFVEELKNLPAQVAMQGSEAMEAISEL